MRLFDMKEWIISIIAIIILTTILNLILPNSKLKGIIKCCFSLVSILVVLQPILSLNISELNFTSVFNGNEIVLQENYLNYVNNEKINNYTQNCISLLDDLGINGAEVIIQTSLNDDFDIKFEKVQVNLKNSVLISDKEHIDIIEDIKKTLSDYLKIEEKLVVIYE